MGNVFEDLSKLGFNNVDGIDLFASREKPKAKQEKPKGPAPEDILYFKQYTCPVCGKSFENGTVKLGKNRLVGTDLDLRPNYETVDSIFYDIINCYHCGYAALARFFEKITDKQCDAVKESICPKYESKRYPLVLTPEMALERYQLALLNAVYKRSANGEKAYICLKIGWIYRGAKKTEKERAYLENAYKGFLLAYGEEKFPICGIEEQTYLYLLGDLARRLGLYSEAMRHLAMVITSKAATQTLKDKARTVRDLINESKAAKTN